MVHSINQDSFVHSFSFVLTFPFLSFVTLHVLSRHLFISHLCAKIADSSAISRSMSAESIPKKIGEDTASNCLYLHSHSLFFLVSSRTLEQFLSFSSFFFFLSFSFSEKYNREREREEEVFLCYLPSAVSLRVRLISGHFLRIVSP